MFKNNHTSDNFMPVKIICDTSADLNLPGDKTLYEEYDIEFVPMHVIFGTDDYKELVDIKTSEFYEKLPTTEVHPSTSQSTQHDLLKAYEKFGDKYDEIISLHLSSKISGAYANAQFAKKMYTKSSPNGAKIHVYDSLTATLPFGLVAIKAAQLAKKGLDATEIIKQIDEFRKNDHVFLCTVGDLKWLFKGGRLSRIKYHLGSFLSKNPILTFIDGSIEVVKSGTGLDKTLDLMMETALEDINDDPQNLTLHFIQATFQQKAEDVAKKFIDNYPGLKMGKIFTMGGVIGAHTGPGTIGIILTRNFEY